MSDHAQTLRDADFERLRAVARLYQTITGMSPTRAEQDATAAACLSGADALARDARNCGNCEHGAANGITLGVETVHCTKHGWFYMGRLLMASTRCEEWATREAE